MGRKEFFLFKEEITSRKIVYKLVHILNINIQQVRLVRTSVGILSRAEETGRVCLAVEGGNISLMEEIIAPLIRESANDCCVSATKTR